MYATLFHCSKQTVLPCRPSPEGDGAEYRTRSASSRTKDEKMVLNDSGHKLQQLGSFQHLCYSVSMTSVMLFRPSIVPQGATLFLLLNRVAVLTDSHVWNFQLYCNVNISRLEQAYAYTDIIWQKENHFGVTFYHHTGGWQLRDVAIVRKGKKIYVKSGANLHHSGNSCYFQAWIHVNCIQVNFMRKALTFT